MCFLEVVDPFGFQGHAVAGRDEVKWSALNDKLLSTARLGSCLLSTSSQLGPPLPSVCLCPAAPRAPSHSHHMRVLSPHSACLWRGQLHLYLNCPKPGPPCWATLGE